MKDTDRIVESKVPDFKQEAEQQNKRLHESFRTELINYTRRVGVNELPDRDLETVVQEVGKKAIDNSPDEVDARAVKVAVESICHDSHGDCADAARKIVADRAIQSE